METPDEARIDIHKHRQQLDALFKGLPHDTRVKPEDRVLIERFVEDRRLGRLAVKGRRKRVSDGRCCKLIQILKRASMLFDVPLDQVDVPRLEKFVLDMEDGKITKLHRQGEPQYSKEGILDFNKVLRSFFKWAHGADTPRYKELAWMLATNAPPKELRTFGFEDTKRMALAIGGMENIAIVFLLFDGGFRAGELFNLRLRDLQFRRDADGRLTCYARIRFSKTKPRTVSLPLATEPLKFWVERHPLGGRVNEQGIIEAIDPDAQVVTLQYPTLCKRLRKIGKKELGERVHPHRFRHASATFYARLLNPYQLCARFGWTMGSPVVQRYIDHAGVMAEDIAAIVRAKVEAPEAPKPKASVWPAEEWEDHPPVLDEAQAISKMV